MPRFIHILIAQRELEIRCCFRILILIQIHGNRVFHPYQREQMEITLHRIVPCMELSYVGIRTVIERLAPMACTVEIAILRTVLYPVMMPHLADIYLTTFRPYNAILFCQFFRLFIYRVVIAEVLRKVIA